MVDNRVIYILSNLSRKEITSLSHFISSKYFNRSKKLISLFNELIKFYPEFSHSKFTKENIYGRLTGGQDYNDSTFRALMHDLLDIVYKFIMIEELKDSVLDSNVNLVKILLNRRLYDIVESEVNKCEKVFGRTDKDFNYLYNRYLFESYKYNYLVYQGKVLNKENVYTERSQFENSESYLTLMYITEMISDFVNAKFSTDKYNTAEIDFPSKILSAINVDTILNCLHQKDIRLLAMLYNALYKVYNDEGNIQLYNEYKELLLENINTLNQDEKYTHFNMLVNYCILVNKNTSNPYFVNELFNIYEYYLMNEIYKRSDNNYLTNATFRNIMVNAIRFGKINWLENFIKVYVNRLHENTRQNMYNYGMTMFYTEIGKYREALEHLEKVKIENFIFKYDLYMEKAKILFSFENLIPLTEHVAAFRQFISKDRLLKTNYKKRYRNFISGIVELAYFREGKNGYDLYEIKNKIESQNELFYKQWLLDQIAGLEKVASAPTARIFQMG